MVSMAPAPDIARSRIFEGLAADDRAHWFSSAERLQLHRGEVLARQGECARTFYLVESGLLKLVQVTAGGDEIILRLVGPSEPFGGVVALKGAAYPVTALALGAVSALGWPAATLVELLDRFPPVRANIMRELADHMTDAMTRVGELATERVEQRVARSLLRPAGRRMVVLDTGRLEAIAREHRR